MKKPEIIMLPLRQCAEMLDYKQRQRYIPKEVFTKPGELGLDVEKRIAEYEDELRSAVKEKQLVGFPGYEGEELAFNIKTFYKWAKENDYYFSEIDEKLLRARIDEMEEKSLLWEFNQRYKKTCVRKFNEKKLKSFLHEPLWNLAEGLMLLDGFEPSGNNDFDLNCVRSDKGANRLYQSAINAHTIGRLELVEKNIFCSLTYKVRPVDLVEWLVAMSADLQMLPQAQKYVESQKTELKEIHHKSKITYLKIIYAILNKNIQNYNPFKKNEETGKIVRMLDGAGVSLDTKTVKAVLDECYDMFVLNKKNLTKAD